MSAQAQTPDNSSEPAFIKNLHITGFFQNTSATWVNSSAQEYNTYGPSSNKTLNRNSLAAERNMIQVDVNDDFTENDSMFMRLWGVYEPSYPWETGCLDKTGGLDGQKVHCTSDFYNQYGIREMWFKHRWGPLQFFVGRQIVTWGESLAFRVGDQINTVDTSWAFGFSNLEQSRIPLWMIHPILNLPSAGPFSSNFAELVYIPGFDFMYTQVDNPGDSLDGLDDIAGRVNINAETPAAVTPAVPTPARKRAGPSLHRRSYWPSSAYREPLAQCRVLHRRSSPSPIPNQNPQCDLGQFADRVAPAYAGGKHGNDDVLPVEP